MSLDHEPRQAIETTTNPNRSNRKRNRIIAGVAGGTALLAAIGAGVGLSGGSDTEAQPNQPVATGKATPGGENSPSAEPTAKATEAQPVGVEYVFDSQTVQVPRVEVGSLESDN
ncbi:MAG TPA: hypothetical protein VFK03_04330, partial [Candidatus Saccharimonadales bacterium]|nr:hypothetical protein [Candidatus Saccharimonadales bacterium]